MKNVEDAYPLSPTQAGMLYHSLVSPTSGVYIEQLHCRIKGPLDIENLQRAWQAVYDRHPALRTAFVWDGIDNPLQIVRSTVSVPIIEEDWSNEPGDTIESRLESFLSRDRVAGFDPERAPLARITLIRLAKEDHHLIWTFHHIVCDGWSTALLIDEVNKVYAGESLPPLPPPYRDFMAWLLARERTNDLKYWSNKLEGLSGPTIIPASLGTRTSGHRQVDRLLETDLCDRVRELARANRVSMSTVIHAAWAVLLSRYCDTDDVVFGSTFSGRPTEVDGIENMIGMFINTVPIRVQLHKSLHVADLLKDTQSAVLDALEHQYVPLTDIQRNTRIRAERQLFSTMLAFENYPATDEQPESGLLGNFTYREQSNYPLALLVVPEPTIRFILVVDTAHYSVPLAARILSHLEETLRTIVRSSAGLVGDVSVIPRTELLQLEDWNRTAVPIPYRSVTEAIEDNAVMHPERPALITGRDNISYGQMVRRAADISSRLVSLGVTSKDRVGLMLPRSPEAIVSMLAVLRAGAAYVPIDPAYPEARIRLITEDAECSAVILQEAGQEKHERHAAVLNLNNVSKAPQSLSIPAATPAPDDLAYVIYTSGSAGSPKGVRITHDNLYSSTMARATVYEDTPVRFLLLPSLSFDSSVAGIYWTLCAGGSVVIPDSLAEQDMIGLGEFIQAHQVTHLLCLPRLYRLLLEYATRTQLQSLKVAIVAGEQCPTDLARVHFDKVPFVRLYNEYGPTEATVWASVYEIRRGFDYDVVPIGKPIPNTSLHVLDAAGRHVPIGIPGELHISGRGIAAGYLNRPSETAERFLSDPLRPGERCYRTGDIVQAIDTGDLAFLGRVDDQVKIRGIRVELGEIEALLRQHPNVRDAVATLAPSKTSRPKNEVYPSDGRSRNDFAAGTLIAVVEANDRSEDESALIENLRQVAQRSLPAHEQPVEFHIVDRIPRLPNGKLAKEELVGLLRTRRTDSTNRGPVAQPRNDVEEAILSVWQSVLAEETIRTTDNFFDVGGDSITSIQVTSKLRELGFDLTPTAVVANPTVYELASHLQKHDGEAATEKSDEDFDPIVVLKQGDSRSPLFCMPTSVGDPVLFSEMARRFPSDRAVYGLRSKAASGLPGFGSLEQMAAFYARHMSKLVPQDGAFHLFSECVGGQLLLETATQLKAMGRNLTSMVILDPGWVYPERSSWYEGSKPLKNRRDVLLEVKGESVQTRVISQLRQARTLLRRVVRRKIRAHRFLKSLDVDHRRAHLAFESAMSKYAPPKAAAHLDFILTEVWQYLNPNWPPRLERWKEVAQYGITLHPTPGDHDVALKGENAVTLAALLAEILETNETVETVHPND